MDLDTMEGILIAAITRDGNVIIPNGSTEIMEDDMIHFIGDSKSINDLVDIYKLNKSRKQIKRAMIFGGGKLGYYLAKRLTEANINVVIIEEDRERCEYLSDNLDNALVIHGDGTDINILDEEELSSMDAFIGATGFDEQNILMCLMAKQLHVRKVIAKISRPSYSHVIDKFGIDAALNPVNITISNILKFIRGGKVVSVSLLLGEQAEVTEVIIDESLDIVGKKVSELGLPKGIIIGAAVHKGKVIIPNGETVINAKDRLIIFSLTEDTAAIDMFLKPKKGGVFSELWHRN